MDEVFLYSSDRDKCTHIRMYTYIAYFVISITFKMFTTNTSLWLETFRQKLILKLEAYHFYEVHVLIFTKWFPDRKRTVNTPNDEAIFAIVYDLHLLIVSNLV